MNIGMTVTGAKELQAMLTRLERKETAKITRDNLKLAQETIMRPAIGAKALGIDRGGESNKGIGMEIAKNLMVVAMKKMHRYSYGRKVIIKETDAFVYFAKDGTRYYIPNAIEYGHAFPGSGRGAYMAMGQTESQARKSASKNKDVKPIPFQRAAYEEKRRPLAEYFAKKVTKAIELAARFK